MSNLPVVSGRACVKALQRVGFRVLRQKGSHIILCRQDPYAQVVVPDHAELDRGTLRGILRHAGLDVDRFVALL
ncbi:MAG: type II toxin-antitoxin system HicA family toxin [FCB group bacterium]|nr:type II toxin-antitoxin system HicA family toxin [FCB group bacterium]